MARSGEDVSGLSRFKALLKRLIDRQGGVEVRLRHIMRWSRLKQLLNEFSWWIVVFKVQDRQIVRFVQQV